MTIAEPGQSVGAPRQLDLYLVPILLAAFMVAQVLAVGARSFLSRPFWLDEFHTLLIARDPSLTHAGRALAHGADFNPPTFYLLCRAACWAFGSSSEIVLRGVTFASAYVALIGIYLSIRQVYNPLVALTAVAATWAHPLLAKYAFEARFYTPWLAAIVWFAYMLNLDDRHNRWWSRALVALTSVLVCTLHYFGIFPLALIALAHSLLARRTPRRLLVGLLPVGFGPLLLLACLPIYLGQKRTLSVPTWVSAPQINMLMIFIEHSFELILFFIASVIFSASLIVSQVSRKLEKYLVSGDLAENGLYRLAGLGALSLMPCVVILFSYTVQPALILRYTIPTLGAIAALIVPLLARSGRGPLVAALTMYLALSMQHLRTEANEKRIRGVAVRHDIETIDRLTGPVLLRSRDTLYQCWWYASELRNRVFLWDCTDLPGRPVNIDQVEHDVARTLGEWYRMPGVVGLKSLSHTPVFCLYGFRPDDIARLSGSHWGKTFRFRRREPDVYEVTLVDPLGLGSDPP